MQVTIQSVEQLKNGVSNGRAWILYKVLAPQVGSFTTFNGGYLQKIGQTVEVNLEKGKNPKYPDDWSEVSEKKNGNGADTEKILAEIRELRAHIDKRFNEMGGETNGEDYDPEADYSEFGA